ncbi:MerR family transcriptional regulator [Sphingobium aquiterrae]|uniref:MerR family transcriptional regulator n=1 Tax=Sphingobium aquiterrae TaxID=2038656 RepID=UPI0030193C23
MKKAEGAFLTIGELADELGLPQHILRYWETRFPQLRPLQRSGNRRYYRPADVDLARRINHLLNVEGFTVRGARKALVDGGANGTSPPRAVRPAVATMTVAVPLPAMENAAARNDDLIRRLEAIRADLVAVLGE